MSGGAYICGNCLHWSPTVLAANREGTCEAAYPLWAKSVHNREMAWNCNATNCEAFHQIIPTEDQPVKKQADPQPLAEDQAVVLAIATALLHGIASSGGQIVEIEIDGAARVARQLVDTVRTG